MKWPRRPSNQARLSATDSRKAGDGSTVSRTPRSAQNPCSWASKRLSAISATADTYRQNHRELAAWRAALDAGALPIERGLRLGAEERRRRTIILRLMCDRRLDYDGLSRELGVGFTTAYATELAGLEDLRADGLVRLTGEGLEVTPVGQPLLRVIAMRFDPLFTAAPGRHAPAI